MERIVNKLSSALMLWEMSLLQDMGSNQTYVERISSLFYGELCPTKINTNPQ